jgi:hypothetical protein
MSEIMIGLWDLKERIALEYSNSGYDTAEDKQGAHDSILEDMSEVESAEDLLDVLMHYGWDRGPAAEFILNCVIDWKRISQWERSEEQIRAEVVKGIVEQGLKPGLPLREFAGTCWTVKEKLDFLQRRAVELGGSYSHRYAQANGPKWWHVGNTAAWEQAAKEAGVEYTFLKVGWDSRRSSFKVFGLTLQGSRGGKTSKTTA